MSWMPQEARWLLLPLAMIVSSVHAADYVIGVDKQVSQSTVGATDGDRKDFDAVNPAVAADPGNRLALVVWSAADGGFAAADPDTGDDKIPTLVDGEYEIFASLLDADLQFSLTNQVRVSTMGDDLETDADERARFAGRHPAVAWNSVTLEYLIVWEGDEESGALVDDEFEIYGQRINRTGELEGERFRISTMGNDAETDPAERARYDALNPVVSVNSVTGEYLVAWQGDTDDGALVDDEMEIFGRLIGADGAPAGEQFRISTTGDDSETIASTRAKFDAIAPVIVFNPVSEQFFVAWESDDSESGLANDEFEIFMQQVSATGTLNGPVVRVSNMGPDGDNAYDAHAPTIAVAPETGATLIGWHGDTDASPLVDDEFEIHARLFDPTGTPTASSRRISTMGPDNATDPAERARYKAEQATASWSEQDKHFLVLWSGDTDAGDLVDDEFEIHGRFVTASGTAAGNRFLVSDMGKNKTDDEASERTKYAAHEPQVANVFGYFVVVWHGDTKTPNNVDNQDIVLLQRVALEHTKLELTKTLPATSPRVPDPANYGFALKNSGDGAARNVHMLFKNTEDFPFTLAGCDSQPEPNECIFDEIAAGETVEFELSVATEQIELGDVQKTRFEVVTYSDVALLEPAAAYDNFFVPVTLTVKGGNGSADWLWLMLVGVPLLARRKHTT